MTAEEDKMKKVLDFKLESMSKSIYTGFKAFLIEKFRVGLYSFPVLEFRIVRLDRVIHSLPWVKDLAFTNSFK